MFKRRCSLLRACLGPFQSVASTQRKHPVENKCEHYLFPRRPRLSPRTHTHTRGANNVTAETVSAKSELSREQSGFAHFVPRLLSSSPKPNNRTRADAGTRAITVSQIGVGTVLDSNIALATISPYVFKQHAVNTVALRTDDNRYLHVL